MKIICIYFSILGLLMLISISCKTSYMSKDNYNKKNQVEASGFVAEEEFNNSKDTASYISIQGIFNNRLSEGIILLDSNCYSNYQLFLGINRYRIISNEDYLNQQKVIENYINLQGKILSNSKINFKVYQKGKIIKSFELNNDEQIEKYIHYLRDHFSCKIREDFNPILIFDEYEDWREK